MCRARGAVRRAGRAPTSGRRVHIDAGARPLSSRSRRKQDGGPVGAGSAAPGCACWMSARLRDAAEVRAGPPRRPPSPRTPRGCRGCRAAPLGVGWGVGAAAAPPTWLTDRGGGGRRGPPPPPPRGAGPQLCLAAPPRAFVCAAAEVAAGGGTGTAAGGSPPPLSPRRPAGGSPPRGCPARPLRRVCGRRCVPAGTGLATPWLPGPPPWSAAGAAAGPRLCAAPRPRADTKAGAVPGKGGERGGLRSLGRAGGVTGKRNPVLGGEGEVCAGVRVGVVARPSLFCAIYTRVLFALLNRAVGATCTMWPREGGGGGGGITFSCMFP